MKNIISIFLLTTIVIAAITCKKTPEIPTGNKIEIGETTIDSVSYYNANVSTIIIATGSNEITQHGHCWSTAKEPTILDSKTTLGKLTKPDTVFSELTGLENNLVYYLRSYITYKNGTLYGTEENIKTLETGTPIVSTNEVSDITLYSAICGGTNNDGGLNITERGLCWNTIGNPTLQNSIGHTSEDPGSGQFIIILKPPPLGVVMYKLLCIKSINFVV